MQDYDSIVLAPADARYSLELVPRFGGCINALVYKAPDGTHVPLIAGHRSSADFGMDRYFRGIPLYPFVNRLMDGHYFHAGKHYQFTMNEPALNNSLHGFLFRLPPQVEGLSTSDHAATVTLVWHYSGEIEAYPFPADIRLHHHLHSDNGLTVTFEVKNRHSGPVPLAIGWHPYFTLGQSVDGLILQLPAVQRIDVDKRKLPTGHKQRFDGFARGACIDGYVFDDCLELLPTADDTACVRLWSPTLGKGIEVWQRVADYPLFQVFIPPDRGSIAIEPVSGGINAFNSGQHLRVLQSEQVFSAQCGVRMMPARP